MHLFIERGIAYYVQRAPYSLKTFRWRIDQKEPTKKTDYEDAFEKFAPAILQSISISNPTPALTWCNYKPMEKYMYKKGEMPKYLQEAVPEIKDSEGFKLQNIMRDDIKFIDSKKSLGVQIADLLASGVRRCLKMGFSDNETDSTLLGGIMIQGKKGEYPIDLITFGAEGSLDKETGKLINIMIRSCRQILKKS